MELAKVLENNPKLPKDEATDGGDTTRVKVENDHQDTKTTVKYPVQSDDVMKNVEQPVIRKSDFDSGGISSAKQTKFPTPLKTNHTKSRSDMSSNQTHEEVTEEFVSTEPVASTSQTSEIELYNRSGNAERIKAPLTTLNVDKLITSCRALIQKIKSQIAVSGEEESRFLDAWRNKLSDVEKGLVFPKTVIGLAGDTGSGKSSLLNALLDCGNVIPTSGTNACTAVVLEVIENIDSTNFEAEIQFVSREKWFDELNNLLTDLTDENGDIMDAALVEDPDARASYCKVQAVYGRVSSFDVLSAQTTVTDWLDKKMTIQSKDPEEFSDLIEQYIAAPEDISGYQFWPIVKNVLLKIPNCDVCRSGAMLVDLPGIRDSNATRDKIAEEYLVNCTEVWVVSEIKRAISESTAQNLLEKNFERQLCMDGLSVSLAHICTSTDDIIPREIMKKFKGLKNETKNDDDQVRRVVEEKRKLEQTLKKARKEKDTLQKQMFSLEKEVQTLKDDLRDLADQENSKKTKVKNNEDEIEKEGEISEIKNRLDQLHKEITDTEHKIMELEISRNIHQKNIAAICARARNKHCKSMLEMNFKTMEMKIRSGNQRNNTANKDLRVFCCSSLEYQRIKNEQLNKETSDGPPQVFRCLEDTQIPALRQYVHELTAERQKQSLERLVGHLGRCVTDLIRCVSERSIEKLDNKQSTEKAVNKQLEDFESTLSAVREQLSKDIASVFDGIKQKAKEGASKAASEASITCAKWGPPSDNTVGYSLSTYRAIVRRFGTFTSSKHGLVDFNTDLAEPFYRSIKDEWIRAFCVSLWDKLDKLKVVEFNKVATKLVQQLEKLGISTDHSQRVITPLCAGIDETLEYIVRDLKDQITKTQRNISRTLIPVVKESLHSDYEKCREQTGQGMFRRIKECMKKGIEGKCETMFEEAANKLMGGLTDLQTEVDKTVQLKFDSLVKDLRLQLEPLWEPTGQSFGLDADFLQSIMDDMRKLHKDAGVPYTEEQAPVLTDPDARETSENTDGNKEQIGPHVVNMHEEHSSSNIIQETMDTDSSQDKKDC